MELVDIIFVSMVLLVFVCVVFWGAEYKTVGDGMDACYRLNSLRGIFAMEIVVGHVIRYDRTLLYPMGKFMIIAVAYFFFVSAFGMARSFQRKENYLQNHFLLPKAGYLFCLAVIVYALAVLTDGLIPLDLGYYQGVRHIILNFPAKTNWYIWEQIFFYILFYLVYSYLKQYRILCITIVTLIMITAVFLAGWSQGFYCSTLAFPLGLYFGEHYERCQNILKGWRGILIAVVLSLIGFGSQLFGTDSLLGMVYLRNIMCLGGIVVLLLVTKRFCFDNAVLRFLGKYSTEIYLLQFIFLWISRVTDWDYKVRIIMVVCTTLTSAVLIHPLFASVKRRLQKYAME